MNISERQNEIIKYVSENEYMSVNELAKLTFTSPSSIRRDLCALENLGMVKRSHGGVSRPEITGNVASFYRRSMKNTKEKRAIAKKASELLSDGQSIMLDSSSTASFLLPYIAKLDSVTVFTNNLETAINSIKQGIPTHCIGGHNINGSVSLGGATAYKTLSEINVDILFFSSQSLNREGIISDSTETENYIRQLMLACARKKVFLCDSTKFDTVSLHKLSNIDDIDIAIFDKSYDELVTKTKIM